MKNLLVTGATGGIGKEICIYFSNIGYKVIGLYNKNKETADFLSEKYGVATYQVDISNQQGVSLALCDIQKKYGKISVVINSAGVTKRGLLQDNTEQDYLDIFNVNVKGVFNICKSLIWDLVETKGDIINISSIWATRPASCEVLYSASKGAIESFTRSLADELKYSGVKVNAISPGFVDTPINKGITEQELKEFLRENNLKRVIDAKEIAELCHKIILSDKTGEIYEIFG